MTCSIKQLLTLCIVQLPVLAFAENNEDNQTPKLTGEVYTEVNYGHKYYGEDRNKWDFPHVVIAADLVLGNGWSLTGEFEYERFYEDGEWGNDFKANYATNKFFVAKKWNEAVNVKAGIIDVPVGITNAGGPALTIYDPESEAALLPMSWHEGGAAFYGRLGKFSYTASALTYITAPFNSSCMIGGAASLGYEPADGVGVSLSGFWGNSKKGMVGYASPEYLGSNGVALASLSATCERDGWIASTSLVYSSDEKAKAVGAEAGFDFGSLTEVENLSIIPFVRYDGVWNALEMPMNKLTLGLNFSLVENLVLKAEYGCRHYCGGDSEQHLDVGLGYSLAF